MAKQIFLATIKAGQTAQAHYVISNTAPNKYSLTVRNIVLPADINISSTDTCSAGPFALTAGLSGQLDLPHKVDALTEQQVSVINHHIVGRPQICNDDLNYFIPVSGQEINIQVVGRNLLDELGTSLDTFFF